VSPTFDHVLPFNLAVGAGPEWLASRRFMAAGIAAEGLPTSGREDFRHTSLRGLPAATLVAPRLPRSWTTDAAPGRSARIVLIDGHFAEAVSDATPFACSLATAVASDLPGVRHLGSTPSPDPLAAVSLATFSDGVFVHVSRLGDVPGYLEIVIVSSEQGAPSLALPRILVVAEDGARVTVVERHLTLGGAPAVTVPVTEVIAGRDSHVRHVRIQTCGRSDVCLATTLASVGQGATFESHLVSLGSETARVGTHVRIDGRGANARLRAVYAPSAGQRLDHYTSVEHVSPGGTSDQVYKGVVGEGGEGSVVARVGIGRRSVDSAAHQLLRALLLGASARANVRPQLEIDCDEVKAAHGASIGQLDPNQLFFLRARGLPIEAARGLLIRGFIAEVLDQLPHPSLAAALTRTVIASLGQSAIDDEEIL
jgi:Fe-S cluster assembly protein SufD